MDKIKKEGLSTSFYEEVIDLIINSSSESDFPIIDLDDLEINVMRFWFSAVPIEYPAISNEGVAYIFNINPSNSNALFNDIQYSMEGGGGSNKINCPYLNCHVKKVVHKCTSAKICEYTENEIKNSSHCE
ncbi:36297_t:CDS:2, partial [Gigaspora margarita]